MSDLKFLRSSSVRTVVLDGMQFECHGVPMSMAYRANNIVDLTGGKIVKSRSGEPRDLTINETEAIRAATDWHMLIQFKRLITGAQEKPVYAPTQHALIPIERYNKAYERFTKDTEEKDIGQKALVQINNRIFSDFVQEELTTRNVLDNPPIYY